MESERLMQEIISKELELNKLKEQYNIAINTEKNIVLNAKTSGIKKSLYLLGFNFESSSGHTQQYLEFHETFKKELTKLLKPYTQEIKFHTPNHFDVGGFFKTNSGQVYYFRLEDLRWSKEDMLIRTAKDFNDFRGGRNEFIKLNDDFVKNLMNYLK